ncbi:nucleotidyl transferase AbiEii/AbiGii toxin family protein [Ginsengibacter hankyongi]|uniref:Nucleotidyl transferase AbiEii/AbiGii toxin family protein n=1 Tax=Ginsengibacter hankyongi TaxID=2607284 RepID=A0A5J5IGK1_9BACT|nr:nucleotidyl transferase AbiEii/AbiGii toxin family protein [Ginsengibacter hankyongi]KAA9036374.1 nucleotidyl transferase AbiEii/AbiGii toxin family protein [Ginsengibacter hankyongi]
MLHYQSVDSETLELLKQLLAINLFRSLRLAGGTSLALQLGHRRSIDLDLFGDIDADVLEINKALSTLGTVTQLKDSKNIHIYLVNGIKVDIVNFTYPWLSDCIQEDGLRLAGFNDIAAMKLSAITGRGTKKDFVDLWFLLQQFTLSEMLQFHLSKYHDSSLFMVLKSLVYFEDAEADEMPYMMIPVKWEKIKSTIIAAHNDYVNRS